VALRMGWRGHRCIEGRGCWRTWGRTCLHGRRFRGASMGSNSAECGHLRGTPCSTGLPAAALAAASSPPGDRWIGAEAIVALWLEPEILAVLRGGLRTQRRSAIVLEPAPAPDPIQHFQRSEAGPPGGLSQACAKAEAVAICGDTTPMHDQHRLLVGAAAARGQAGGGRFPSRRRWLRAFNAAMVERAGPRRASPLAGSPSNNGICRR